MFIFFIKNHYVTKKFAVKIFGQYGLLCNNICIQIRWDACLFIFFSKKNIFKYLFVRSFSYITNIFVSLFVKDIPRASHSVFSF